MESFLTKLSSYNIFNYLIPGVIFVTITDEMGLTSLAQDELIINVFIYYFAGLIISRVGSLIIEPFLKWITFVTFADYKKFVIASQKDTKIEVLSEANNMYRTFISMLTLLLLGTLYGFIATKVPALESYKEWIMITLMLILFIASYKKQTDYIYKRVNAQQK